MTKPTATAIRDFDITGKIGDLYPPNCATVSACRALATVASEAPSDTAEMLELAAQASAALDKDTPEWPMYSYSRPAYLLWNAIARELFAAGWTEARIKDWLQSKSTRRAQDIRQGRRVTATA